MKLTQVTVIHRHMLYLPYKWPKVLQLRTKSPLWGVGCRGVSAGRAALLLPLGKRLRCGGLI